MSAYEAFREGYGMAIAAALVTWLIGAALSIHDPVVYLVGFLLISAGVQVFYPPARLKGKGR